MTEQEFVVSYQTFSECFLDGVIKTPPRLAGIRSHYYKNILRWNITFHSPIIYNGNTKCWVVFARV